MRSKAAFIVGTGLGYVLGTRAGRQRFESIKKWSTTFWQNPQVQARVTDLEAKAADFARTEGAAIKGRVTENLRSTVRSTRGGSSTPIERYPVAPSGAPATGGGTSTADGAPFLTPPGATNGSGHS
jgi:hypothetical protein